MLMQGGLCYRASHHAGAVFIRYQVQSHTEVKTPEKGYSRGGKVWGLYTLIHNPAHKTKEHLSVVFNISGG